MGTTVLADAQFGIVRTLRPYTGFDSLTARTTTTAEFTEPGKGGVITIDLASVVGVTVGSWIWVPFDTVTGAAIAFRVLSIAGLTVTVQQTNPTFGSIVVPAGTQVNLAGSYDGISGVAPIMFTEGGAPLDDLAGKPGYSDSLVRGLSVPLGSRMVIWLPNIASTPRYYWTISWRMRNTFDFRTARRAYHYPKAALGVPDDQGPVGGGSQPRVVLPAAVTSLLSTTVPGDPLVFPTVTTLNPEWAATQFAFANYAQPLTPSGVAGQIQQGILPWDTGSSAPSLAGPVPTFIPYELQALGDEMMIGLVKAVSLSDIGAQKPWNFDYAGTGWPQVGDPTDAIVSWLFGDGSGTRYPDIGVYVLTGSAP